MYKILGDKIVQVLSIISIDFYFYIVPKQPKVSSPPPTPQNIRLGPYATSLWQNWVEKLLIG